TLVAGFLFLHQGAIDLASVALTLGYCAFTPLAILGFAGSDGDPESEVNAPPYRWALAMGLCVFAVYRATLAPTTTFWDTSEYIAAAKVLGIPHPPGNPLFIILAHSFGLLPLAASYAVRINLFAAVTSAASAGLWFLVAERWLRGIVAPRWARYAAAFGGV